MPVGMPIACGVYRDVFFDWDELKRDIEKNHQNPIILFFKEITEDEFNSFAKSFKG
jgi:hypothetical protein